MTQAGCINFFSYRGDLLRRAEFFTAKIHGTDIEGQEHTDKLAEAVIAPSLTRLVKQKPRNSQ